MQTRFVLPVIALSAALFFNACAWKPITEQDVRAPENVYKKWVFDRSLESIGQSFAAYSANCDHEMPFVMDKDNAKHASLIYPSGVASFEKPSIVAVVDFLERCDGTTQATVFVHDEAYYLQRRTVDNLPAIIMDPLRCDWQ